MSRESLLAAVSDECLVAEVRRRQSKKRRRAAIDATIHGPCAADVPPRSPVEEEVLDLLVDWHSRARPTLDVIGRLLGGLSRERIRQHEQAALAKLRARLNPEWRHVIADIDGATRGSTINLSRRA